MKLELTEEEVLFLRNLLSGATVQGADAMRRLIAILDKLLVNNERIP